MPEDKLIIKRRGDDGYRVISIRIRESVSNRLDAIAAETNRSRNEVIGLLLDFALEHAAVEKRPPEDRQGGEGG